MQGGTSFRMRAGQLFCACDSDGLPLAVGREPDRASIRVMALAFALSVLAQILTVSVLPLVSAPLAPSPQAVAWPYIALLAGGALSSFPASILLDLFGRRAAFALGASLGLAGGMMSYWAVMHGQYIGLVIGVDFPAFHVTPSDPVTAALGAAREVMPLSALLMVPTTLPVRPLTVAPLTEQPASLREIVEASG